MPKTMINRITMQGFKSFNRRISIPLMKGFNVFCGPNGVGKSNIIDAVCFVLGRTSAKSMRAGRLHELIFHGGDGKTPAKQAVVSLYLTNENKMFSYDDIEISITRKVNKKGVSVYKINGRTTTRQKVLELLSSARIYPDGHNIVMQGDITQIIEMNAKERRGMIDEISGISEYNDKKDKANKDLEKVDQKLREAEILINERFERFKRLEEERNAALRYQSLQKRLALLRASLAHKKVETFKEKIKNVDEGIDKKQFKSEQLDEKIAKLEADIDQREENMRDVADRLIDMSKRVGEEKKVSDIRSRIMIVKNQIDSHTREIERITSITDKLQAFESRKSELSGHMPRAVKTIIRLKIRGVHGTVRDLISVPEKHSVAIEVAAGRHLNDIVVDNDEVASYCIDYLKREKIGRATFLPLNKIRPSLFKNTKMLNKSGVIGIASRLVKYDTKFMKAIEFVLGRTLVVENMDTARALGIGSARMVTLEGDLIEYSGAMIGGHFIRSHMKSVEKSSSSEIDRYSKERRKLQDEIETLKSELTDLEKELKKYAKSESVKESIDLHKLRVSSEREMDKLRAKRKRAYERKVKIQTDLNKLHVEKASIEAELKSASIEVSQYGEMDYIDESITALERFLKKAADEIQAIGLVNMKAIEEYEKFRSQFDEYKRKYEKILEEKKAVMDMIEEIEKKRMEVFYSCLKIVSQHFSRIFSKMTPGTASLELEDPSDLESGLLIQANPKGKRTVNIDSMSGGEKTLTALAFIFAIQNYKPAPFYILDEVDAALDKENSKKIAELIKSLSTNEQIVMITHNDQTIKYGDRVYGVTMERGESKILGVELPKS
jgi:chromosome segregation protein